MNTYKHVSVLLSAGIMWIGLITFCISGASAHAESSAAITEDISPTTAPVITLAVTAAPTPAPTEIPAPPADNDLLCEQDSGIHRLVADYLNAKLTCTYEAFEGIVTDPYLIELEDVQHRTEAITAYKELTCYTKRGYGIIDYVVYFTYSMDIVNIEEPVLALDSLFVTTAEDGSYRVFIGDLDHETVVALDSLNDDADVQALVEASFLEMETAAAENESVLEFWRNLYEESVGDEEVSEDTATEANQ